MSASCLVSALYIGKGKGRGKGISESSSVIVNMRSKSLDGNFEELAARPNLELSSVRLSLTLGYMVTPYGNSRPLDLLPNIIFTIDATRLGLE